MTEPILLVVDYPGRRAEARIADLCLEDAGFDVRQLLTAPFARELDGAAYAAELVGRHGPFGDGVTAVLAYCVAAPVAQEVAALVSAGRSPVPLVLFDGEPPTVDSIGEQCTLVVMQVAASLGGSASLAHAEFIDHETLSARPGELMARLRRHVVALGTSALRADGVDEAATETAEEVADFYLSYLGYLVAAYRTGWPPWGGDVLHVVSRRHEPAERWPGARSQRVRRVDVERAELLRHPETKELVRLFLRSVQQAG